MLNSFVNLSICWEIEPILMTQFNRINLDDPYFKQWIFQRGYGHESSDFVRIYKELNDIVRDVAKKYSLYLIDLDKEVPKNSRYMYDVIHLNRNGNIFVGDICTKELFCIINK